MELVAFNPGPQQLLIVLIIVLILFGGAKLPDLARSLGRAKKEFESGMHEDDPEPEPSKREAAGQERPDHEAP